GVEACQTTTNEPTAVLAGHLEIADEHVQSSITSPTLTFASASGGLPTSMIPSAVHPQDLSRDLLTERSWGTSREGGSRMTSRPRQCEDRELSPAHTQRSRPRASSATLALP